MYQKNIWLKVSTIIVVCLLSLQSFAENWDIPADKRAKNSYIPFTSAVAKEGETMFTKNCIQCHGIPGTGNMLKTLKPMPPDLSSAITQARTDGDLFYIITNGRMVMPSFKNVFSEDERWKIISYLRSFHKGYVQVLSKFDPRKSKLVKLSLSFNPLTHLVCVEIKATEKTGIVLLKNDEVELFATRYFGRLKIDKSMTTNNQGIAYFKFPEDLPGDKTGLVELVAKVSDDNYGEVEKQNKFKIGIPTDKPPLTAKRAIWNVVEKAPVWLLITYTSGVLFFVLFLAFILNNLRKLKKAGTT